MNKTELAWLAGLLEGEGTFTPHRSKRKTKYGLLLTTQLRVQVQMNDRDVVQRVATLVGANLLGPYNNKRTTLPSFSGEKAQCWVVSLVGKKARAVLSKILPYMGERRKAQIEAALREEGSIRVYD